MESKFKLIALFLLSVAFLCFELFNMRVFSEGSWSNFGSLVIGTAMLGMGLSGTILTFLREKVKKSPDLWFFGASLAFLLTSSLGHVLSQRISFNPIFLGTESYQFFLIGLYYLMYGVPFFFSAVFISVCFITLNTDIYKLYFWNMAGSGLGGVLFIVLTFYLPTQLIIIPILFIAYLAVIMVTLQIDKNKKAVFSIYHFIITTVVFIFSIFLSFLWGDINVSEYKAISYARKYPDSRLVSHTNSPIGTLEVVKSSFFHFAPGLSDQAILELEKEPTQPYLGLFIDGNGPIGIMGSLVSDEAAYMDFLPMSAPYEIRYNPDCLLINLSGGISLQVALYQNARRVVMAENNPVLVSLFRDDPVVNRFTGNIINNPKVSVVEGEARVVARDNPESFDIVEISLIDSIGLSNAGGYSITENYTYTTEAIQDYMSSLKTDGLLSITTWDRLDPPRNVPKLINTIFAAMRQNGVKEPEKQLFIFNLFRSTATILIKNSPYEPAEIEALRRFTTRCYFDNLYYPGIKESSGQTIDDILLSYRMYFDQDLASRSPKEHEVYNSALFYHHQVFAGQNSDLERVADEYVFDIDPMTDNRPYYSNYLKLASLPLVVDQLQDISEDWGSLILVASLIQALIFGLLIILIPVIGRWRHLFQSEKGLGRVILYFSFLGIGYMLVEIVLIQKLVFFLSNPIYSTTIVITSMLIISGLGNLTVNNLVKNKRLAVLVVAIAISVIVILYLIFLDSILMVFHSYGMPFRIVISVLVISPLAFLLGVPFPSGLNALTDNRDYLLPWAWGMNGGFSVVGTALVKLLSERFGFSVIFIIVSFLYIAVGVIFGANEFKGADKRRPEPDGLADGQKEAVAR